MLEESGQRRLDVEGVSTRKTNEARVAGDEVVGGFEVDGKDGGEGVRGGWEGV